MTTFYAADNSYGSETDAGFYNTSYVIAFPSKAARDEYVAASPRCSTIAIKASQIREHGAVTCRQSANGSIEQVW